MKRVMTTELINWVNRESLGFSPILKEKGKRNQMILKDGEPIAFKTEKQARQHGIDFWQV